MNSPGQSWSPSPELLAAYSDGELDSRPELSQVRLRLERWLEDHPDAAEELNRQRQLQRLFEQNKAVEPSPAVWEAVWSRVIWTRHDAAGRGKLRVLSALAAVAAAVFLLIVASQFWPGRNPAADLAVGPPSVAGVQAKLPAGDAELAGTILLLQAHEVAFMAPAEAEPQIELKTCGNKTAVVWSPLPSECKKVPQKK